VIFLRFSVDMVVVLVWFWCCRLVFLLVERLVQINDEVVRVGCIFAERHYRSPKLFAAATLALYAAFVMLVLVLIVPEV
jgi:hypothetical protein